MKNEKNNRFVQPRDKYFRPTQGQARNVLLKAGSVHSNKQEELEVVEEETEDEGEIQIQGGWGGWPTGNGKKLSSCQAQLGQATFLAVA